MDRPRIRERLFAPVDNSWLVLLRIALGLLMLWHVASYLGEGRVTRFWIEPDFHFKFRFFEWLEPWPGRGMVLHFQVLGVLALGIATGFLYRVCAALFFLGFAYVFLLEQARYQNHTYLICLVSFLAIFLPANRCFSVDAWRRPELREDTAPAWTLWLMRFQVGVPYFFGGLAKLNADWLRGEPLREWLPRDADFPLLGPYLGTEGMIALFSYGGLTLDLFAVPLLCWRRTRLATFVVLFGFHCTNARLFTIGVFPWMMILLTTVFFEPDWPRRLLADFARPRRRAGAGLGAIVAAGFALGLTRTLAPPAVLAAAVAGAWLGWQFTGARRDVPRERVGDAAPTPSRPALSALALWIAIQVLVPLRHFLIPGPVAWTREGQRFSWHMKLNDTDGQVVFEIVDPVTGEETEVDPWERLAAWQVSRMDGRPHMILQYARHLADETERAAGARPEVRAVAWVSLNNRPAQRLIDPGVDLARVPRPAPLGHAPWIYPLLVGERQGGVRKGPSAR